MKLLTLCLQLLFQPNKYTWLPWHFMPLLLSGQNDISDPKLKPMIEEAKPNWLSAKHWSHHKIENPKTPRSTLLHKQSTHELWNQTNGAKYRHWYLNTGNPLFLEQLRLGLWQMLLQNWNCHPHASYKPPLGHKSQHGNRPNTNYLWTTEPTWIQARYKLPLGQKSQHGYRSSHTIFGPPRATKESKLTLNLNTEQNLMNSVISMHGLNTSERHRRPSRKLGRTRRQHVTTVQASIV